ncbi:helix-turn-helix domain-containing protein [Kocuria sp. KH4]
MENGWILPPEVMTADEVAEYLRTSRAAVNRMRRAGKLPGFLVGRQYHFRREVVEAYTRGDLCPDNAATAAEPPRGYTGSS